MKIQCDVCSKNEALLFCTADDAALCSACDHRLHLAASNHHRFPLLHSDNSNNNHFPLCDICQERRAFLFCQQDRAILCKDCDLPIHSVNRLTRNHERFLLTGVELSCVSASLPNSQPLPANVSSTSISHSPSVAESSTSTAPIATADAMNGVAEYLIEALPDWHFEEFIGSSSTSTTAPPPFAFSKWN
ncbi:B-box zinc finger protein 21-like isoform X2 [Benincasa hispida]|uniref:B-box zinc finger protein 21-like isoform X2 n=1 Tax=Benincasa hispida TaxID=102211 RepID=UPI0019011248|nr:B-box zinc finger protein 21-like isoform X2 [Benincasa hispida]